jgi:hypothetical protein
VFFHLYFKEVINLKIVFASSIFLALNHCKILICENQFDWSSSKATFVFLICFVNLNIINVGFDNFQTQLELKTRKTKVNFNDKGNWFLS